MKPIWIRVVCLLVAILATFCIVIGLKPDPATNFMVGFGLGFVSQVVALKIIDAGEFHES